MLFRFNLKIAKKIQSCSYSDSLHRFVIGKVPHWFEVRLLPRKDCLQPIKPSKLSFFLSSVLYHYKSLKIIEKIRITARERKHTMFTFRYFSEKKRHRYFRSANGLSEVNYHF